MGTQDRRLAAVQPLVSSLESFRIALQKDLDIGKAIDARRRLGQFATPTKLAYDIVSFGLTLNKNSSISFLDPAFGTGVFYSALIDIFGVDNISDAKGIEIDPYYGVPSQRLWASMDIDIQIDDFTKLMPEKKFNFIICNPPYVRHHLIDSHEKLRIKEKTFQTSGVKLSGLAGLYCHFLLQSYQWMDDEGIAGWLIPSEFMDVNYGKELKQFLLTKVELLRIHRFDPNEVQFDDALVSSSVVWIRKKKPSYSSKIEFSFGGTLVQPKIIKSVNLSTLKNDNKWTRFPEFDTNAVDGNQSRLSDLFTVKRGIATGNNEFFILDEEKIRRLDLPFKFFRPILPSARYVNQLEILADNEGNPILPHKLFLLDCRLPEDELKENYPTVWSYLESGKETVSTGYLCKSRKLWYLQEHRDAPPFICTYMGRDSVKGSAFRFILNHSDAIVTNSYLALYPNEFLSQKLSSNPKLKRLIWKILNSISTNTIIGEGRTYGGGLRKIEPTELLNVPIPESLIKHLRSDYIETGHGINQEDTICN